MGRMYGSALPTSSGRGTDIRSLRRNCLPLDLAPARERPAERDLVGVLEVAADGESAREPRHGRPVAEPVGEIGGGRLAGHVRVRREHDLADLALRDALE